MGKQETSSGGGSNDYLRGKGAAGKELTPLREFGKKKMGWAEEERKGRGGD